MLKTTIGDLPNGNTVNRFRCPWFFPSEVNWGMPSLHESLKGCCANSPCVEKVARNIIKSNALAKNVIKILS